MVRTAFIIYFLVVHNEEFMNIYWTLWMTFFFLFGVLVGYPLSIWFGRLGWIIGFPVGFYLGILLGRLWNYIFKRDFSQTGDFDDWK